MTSHHIGDAPWEIPSSPFCVLGLCIPDLVMIGFVVFSRPFPRDLGCHWHRSWLLQLGWPRLLKAGRRHSRKYFASNSHIGAVLVALNGEGYCCPWKLNKNKLDRFRSLTTMHAWMQSINQLSLLSTCDTAITTFPVGKGVVRVTAFRQFFDPPWIATFL